MQITQFIIDHIGLYVFLWWLFGVLLDTLAVAQSEHKISLGDILTSCFVGMLWPVIPIGLIADLIEQSHKIIFWKRS